MTATSVRNDLIEGVVVRKSNSLINAKYKTSILGNKIIAVSLTKLQQEPGSKQVMATLYPSEIKRILGNETDTNIYKKLKSVSKQLAGNIITIEDGLGNFHTFTMITNVSYKDQKLEIIYNREMTPHITSLQKSYTSMELATLVSFEKNSSFRLYELLKKEAYKIDTTKSKFVTKVYSVDELRCTLGLVNLDASYLQRAVSDGATWSELVHLAKKEDKQYERFTDFRTKVLDEAKIEMDEKADITFEYTVERGNRGRATDILFMISWNIPESNLETIHKNKEKIEQLSPEYVKVAEPDPFEKVDAADMKSGAKKLREYSEILTYLKKSGIRATSGFTMEYYDRLLKDAGGDTDEIKREIDYAKTGGMTIRNYFGWLREAVRNRYADNVVEAVEGGTEEAETAKELHRESHSNRTKELVWERYKQKDNFQDFVESIGVPLEAMELAFDIDERIKMYMDFTVESMRS